MAPKENPAVEAGPALTNTKVRDHVFLEQMLGDDYFPKHLVKKGQRLLLELAANIERERPKGEAVYALTHATTEAFNELQQEFDAAESEIETAARENIGADIEFLLETYGYEVDVEAAIAPREW